MMCSAMNMYRFEPQIVICSKSRSQFSHKIRIGNENSKRGRFKYTVTLLWFEKVCFCSDKTLELYCNYSPKWFWLLQKFYSHWYIQWKRQLFTFFRFLGAFIFIINFIRISVLVYQIAFDHNCNGNMAIILRTLVQSQYNWINRYNHKLREKSRLANC